MAEKLTGMEQEYLKDQAQAEANLEILLKEIKDSQQTAIESAKKQAEYANIVSVLLKERDKDKKKAEAAAKRGRPHSYEREICEWMRNGLCETIFGSNGDVFIELNSTKNREYNGRYSLTGTLPGMKRLDDVLVILRTEETGEQPAPEQMTKGIEMYLQRTRPGARTLQVAKRVGHCIEDNQLVKYVDMGFSKQFIRIDASGITVVPSCPEILFIPEQKTRELPEPKPGMTFRDLEEINPLGLGGAILRAIFMYQLQLLLMDRNFVNLFFRGPERSGKSSRASYTQNVLQPPENFQISEGMSRQYEDVLLRGMTTLSLSYDNISIIDRDQSDYLCRMSTGAKLAKRMLYHDKAMIDLETQNPVIITSIYDAITRKDLLSRTLIVNGYARNEDEGDDPQKLEDDFWSLHPYWLGALCDAASGALKHIDEVRNTGLGDKAAFERWMIAAGIGLTHKGVIGWSESEVSRIIRYFSSGRHDLSPLMQAVQILLIKYTNKSFEYRKSATELLMDLRKVAARYEIALELPGDPEHLSKMLNDSGYEMWVNDVWCKTGIKGTNANETLLRMLMTGEDMAIRIATAIGE